MERRFGIGVTREGAGQYGYQCFPIDEVNGRDIYPRIGQVQGSSNVVTNPTLQWCCTILPGIPQFHGQYNTPAWRKRHRMPTGDRGAALVHRSMLPGTGIKGDNSVHGGCDERETRGGRADCHGRIQC